MIANFKNDKKIIVTGADKAEALLVQNLIDASKVEGKKLSISPFYDVVGDVYGFSLDLEDEVEPVTEPITEPVTEP